MLPLAEVESIIQRIQSGRLAATAREPVRHVETRRNAEAPPLCPKCASPMLLRSVKAGPNAGNRFWCCPQHPKCRATLNVADTDGP
ncbi:MAG: hypothetical protein ACKN9W_03290 [Methylococcus sp.]